MLFSQRNAICFLTREYNKIFFDFAETFQEYYDVYILVDDNSEFHLPLSKVKIIQISEQECLDHNYTNSTYRFKQTVSGWDKAFYYFCEKVNYNHVWFIEDDIFISNVKAIINIDNKYQDTDMICQGNREIFDEFPLTDFNLPIKIRNDLNVKIYQTMCCAMRISKNVLDLIKKTTITKKQLYFHEVFILSIVKHYNLSYIIAPELEYIIFRKKWKYNLIKRKPYNLFHPIKDMELQKKLRDYINYKN